MDTGLLFIVTSHLPPFFLVISATNTLWNWMMVMLAQVCVHFRTNFMTCDLYSNIAIHQYNTSGDCVTPELEMSLYDY